MPTVTLLGNWDSGTTASGVNSVSVTRNQAVSPGDLLIVCAFGNVQNNITSVVDGQFGTLSTYSGTTNWDATDASWVQFFWAVATQASSGSASNQITASFSSSTGYAEVVAAQFRCSAGSVFSSTASVLGASVNNGPQVSPGTAAGAIVSGSTNFATVPKLAFAISVDVTGSGGQTLATTGWSSTFTGNRGAIVPGWSVISSTGFQQATWTAAAAEGSQTYQAVLAGFNISGASVSVTSVNGGNPIDENATGVAFTGSGFLSGMTAAIVQSGGSNATVPQANVVYVDASDGRFDLIMEPSSGAQLAFSDSVYSHSLQVTSGTNSGSGATSLAPPAGFVFKTLTSINSTSAYRITATPDLVIHDQLEASGNSIGTLAAPPGLQLNADATFTFLSGYVAQTFWVRAYDSVNQVWGPWAEQIAGNVIVPDVTLLALASAQSVLSSAGLNIWSVVNQTSSTVPTGDVISTSPAAGSSVPPTTSITIYVSSGSSGGSGGGTNPTQAASFTTIEPAGQTSLQNTIPAYLYQQFQDDDNLRAFVDAYNAYSQYYLDWFNSVSLPFYPGLSAPLLDWVAEGLYGVERTSLASPVTPAVGPLNTSELNTIELNSWSPPTQTLYEISDDVLKRIITWDFYKGDGTRFNARWLKRRVMRFLMGVDGLDPSPWYPSAWPGIGTENTQAISVQITGETLTVTINGAVISALTQLGAGILQYFKLAFESGVLDVPAEFTSVVCNVVWTLTANVLPSIETVSGIATTLSTGNAIVTAIGGNGVYTYAWTWQSGGSGITINSPSSNTTSFTASGMTRGTSRSGIAVCTVTDSASHTATATVSVTIQNISAPSLTISPSSISNSGSSSSELTALVTALVSGGGSPFTYSWGWQSGGAGIIITNPTNVSTSFEANNLSAGQTVSGTAICTVTDAYGQQASATCNVALSRITQVSATCSPSSETAVSSTQPITSGTTTVTASGGRSPYTYRWSWQSGGANISINSSTTASTSFTGNGLSPGQTASGVAKCVVTDSAGQQATTTCSVSIKYLPPLIQSYTTAQNVTVPTGYSTAIVEQWGAAGGSQGGSGGSLCTAQYGAGSGAGAYARSQFSVTGGQTIQIPAMGVPGTGGATGYGVGTAGTATVVVFGATTVTANGGQPGNNSGGAGGTASGGNQANATGGSGGASEINGGTGAGGLTTNGIYGNNPASYGNGSHGGLRAGATGGAGLVVIRFS